MEEKKPLLDSEKASEIPNAVTPHTPSIHTRFHRLLPSLVHLAFALCLLYSLHFWLSVRRELAAAELLQDDYTWPTAFYPHHKHGGSHEILKGEFIERIFLEVPDEESAIAASRAYATLPHIAGSDQDLVTAKYVLDLFQRSFGIPPPPDDPIFAAGSVESRNATLNIPQTTEPRAWIDTYYPVLNTPLDHSLEILNGDGSVSVSIDLEEVGDPLDEDAAEARTAVPVFHGLSKDGNVTGKLFYANYGRQEDYDAVERSGVNITGKIALVRYGAVFRGLKIKGAQERGAVGALIYSDPRDDGSVVEENGYLPYPHGPARNPTSVQRGSVQFISSYPGDPTTPGYPAYENSTRTAGTNIPSIPSLPISWLTAKALLDEISDNGENRNIRLVNRVNDTITPIWNTMVVIPGHIKDEVVVLGNHRDAWVLGAADPSSGSATLHEIVRGLGVLHRKGWRPLRTIVIASWDAEEYGLVGSTEWGEDFPTWITDHVVAYINVDVSVSGSNFAVKGSPSLAHLLKQAALDIPHPTKERTLWDATQDQGELIGPVDPEVAAMAQVEGQNAKAGLGVSPLGSGSDYTVFLQRLGVASSDCGFGPTLTDPVYHYHSIYDSERFQELYADPGFHRHVAVSKFLGLVTLRLADSIVLPLNTTYYTEELSSYADKVENIAKGLELKVNFSSLRTAIDKLHNASTALDKEKAAAEKNLLQIVKKWRRHHGGHYHHRCRSGLRGFSKWVKRAFGVADDNGHEHDPEGPWHPPHHGDGPDPERPSHPPHHGHDHDEHPPHDDYPPHHPHDDYPPPPHHPHEPPHRHWPPHRPHFPRPRPPHRLPRPPRKLIKAIKRVERVNKKLAGFEHGFISEEGIADREWYKHLGVAPGKWLGYGATTLPALTEALSIEKNSTLAEHEVERLTKLLEKLARSIAV